MRSSPSAAPAWSASGAPCRSSSRRASSSRRRSSTTTRAASSSTAASAASSRSARSSTSRAGPQNEQPRDAAQEIAEKLQPYVGRKLRLKILEVNRKANRLILSEKVALYEERREKRDELFSSLKVGQHVKGSVRSIAPFGVFVDLGGIDGLVHKSELSWNKVNNPESGYRVGEEVEAEVIDINHERGRISLSIRRLQPDPWNSTVADLKVGDVIEGTVTKIVNFGAFVRVREGLEGLIHISELSHQRVAHPGDVVHEGQRIKLKVISLDSERHRLGLSLKQAEEAPPRPAAEPRGERRPRPERGYDMAQAVQEPEGGIDNTLAAAFAQVRQQVAEQESQRAKAERVETAVVAETVAVEAEVVAEVAAIEADEAVVEAIVAEEIAEEAVADAIVAEEIAEEAVAEAAETQTAEAEEIAEEAAAEAFVADEIAEEAVAEAFVAEEIAEEAVARGGRRRGGRDRRRGRRRDRRGRGERLTLGSTPSHLERRPVGRRTGGPSSFPDRHADASGPPGAIGPTGC